MKRGKKLKTWAPLVLAIAALTTTSARALTIVPTFGSDVTSLSNAAQVEAAFNYAAQQYEQMYINPITINVTVDTETTGLGNSTPVGTNFFSYSMVRNAMTFNASTADQETNLAFNWPTNDPTGNNSQYVMTTAQAKALGLISGNNPASDATFYFNTNVAYTLDPYDRTVATGETFDFIGVVEHELSEIMGRIQKYGAVSGGKATYTPYDLSRYSAPGVRDFVPSNAGDYFSIDGGDTNLKGFNSTVGGDGWDWVGPSTYPDPTYVADSYNAFSAWDNTNAITPVDAEAMDILGYNRGSTALTFTG